MPQIIRAVLEDYGYSGLLVDRLVWSYRTREYCVQYRESDFDFLSRLMEEEGIYYFFEHEEGRHILVLADDHSCHSPRSGYEEIPYFPPDSHDHRERDHINAWRVEQRVKSGGYVLKDFDFEKPKATLETKRINVRDHANATFEMFDYPGGYRSTDDGEHYVKARLEEVQSDGEVLYGGGNARGIGTGSLFKLTGCPREDQNREYLTVSASYAIESDEYESSAGVGSGAVFSCSFTAIDSRLPYRPKRLTQKPVIQGPQTAIVVGKAGEEIWTDEYGRVKVQFHWDRYGQSDENSSCWVRVAQLWAGGRWGAMYTPRIGQEVIVEFLEGDPDRPIITGRVYNRDVMPPYELPRYCTRSTIKSNSSKGGGGGNELRFEDKKGGEQVFLHAQKDLDQRVKNDLRSFVGNNQHEIVKANRMQLTEGDAHEQVKGQHLAKVDGNLSLEVGGQRDEKVGTVYAVDAGQEIHLKSGAKLIIEGGVQVTIKGAGGFIDIGPAGITIQGSMVKVNSGGSAGSGSGASTTSPDAPEEAEDY